MIYLVDANVICETTKPSPSVNVVEWLRSNESELAVDPIVLGEISFGILLLPAGKRRRRLADWFGQVIAKMNCIPWDAATGLRWAELLAELRKVGDTMPIKDSLIAATALVHDLTVATRNVADFKKVNVKVVDPFI